jgi:hypothetical protein
MSCDANPAVEPEGGDGFHARISFGVLVVVLLL